MKIFEKLNNFNKISDIDYVCVFEDKKLFNCKITIAIPTYRRPEYLKIAIESALNQKNFTDYCVIVVDNDPVRNCKTEKMLKKYEKSGLSYYKNNQNLGMCNNWNRCIQLSKSNYVTILHDDDWLSLNFLNKIDPYIFNDYGIISNRFIFKNNLKIESRKKNLIAIAKLFMPKITNLSLFDFFIGHPNPGTLGIVYNTECLKKIGGFNDEYYPVHDYVLNINYQKNFGFKFLRSKYNYYRIEVNESFSVASKTFELNNIVRNTFLKEIYKSAFFIKLSDLLKFFNMLYLADNFNLQDYKFIKNLNFYIKKSSISLFLKLHYIIRYL